MKDDRRNSKFKMTKKYQNGRKPIKIKTEDDQKKIKLEDNQRKSKWKITKRIIWKTRNKIINVRQ